MEEKGKPVGAMTTHDDTKHPSDPDLTGDPRDPNAKPAPQPGEPAADGSAAPGGGEARPGE